MVIRDLTLRSAASFGSFHLIRLLFDEYMFYLVEHKVAASTGKTAIAIMSEVSAYVIQPVVQRCMYVRPYIHTCLVHKTRMRLLSKYSYVVMVVM